MNKPYRSEVLSCLYVNKINIDIAPDFAGCPWHWLTLSVPVTNSLRQEFYLSCTCKALISCCLVPCGDTCLRANCLKLYWIWWTSFICSSSFQIAETSLIFVAMYLVSKRESSARCNFLSRLFSWCYILENDIFYVWFHSDNCFLMPSLVLRCDVNSRQAHKPNILSILDACSTKEGKTSFFPAWTRIYCLTGFLMQKQWNSVAIQSYIKARWRPIANFWWLVSCSMILLNKRSRGCFLSVSKINYTSTDCTGHCTEERLSTI